MANLEVLIRTFKKNDYEGKKLKKKHTQYFTYLPSSNIIHFNRVIAVYLIAVVFILSLLENKRFYFGQTLLRCTFESTPSISLDIHNIFILLM